jgi:hypothetical protein
MYMELCKYEDINSINNIHEQKNGDGVMYI